jgi:hypothetical protein
MTMRVNTIATHLRPEEALTVIEFLDQLRERLMQTYGDEIMALMQEASPRGPSSSDAGEDDPCEGF